MGQQLQRNVSLFSICLAVLLMQVNANFARVCPLGLVPPKWLVIEANDTKEVVDIPSRRLKNQDSSSVSPAIILGNGNGNGTSNPYRMLQVGENVSNYTRIIQVMQCICGDLVHHDAYCEATNNACGVHFDGAVGCYVETTRLILLRNAWPIVILWYAALVLFIFMTQQGRYARQFLYVRCCNRRWNNQLVDQILQPTQRRRLRSTIQFWDLSDPSLILIFNNSPEEEETQENIQPRRLALKTKRYTARVSDEEEPLTCTICFAVLQDGDRVGALPCQHEFHVDCLKTWICRRNVCPLCQAPNVASPHADEDTEPTPESGPQENDDEHGRGRSLDETQENVGNHGPRPT